MTLPVRPSPPELLPREVRAARDEMRTAIDEAHVLADAIEEQIRLLKEGLDE